MIFIKHTHLLLQILKNACTHFYPISDVWEHFILTPQKHY